MPVQHGHQHRDAVRVHAVDRAPRRRQHRIRHQRLHLDRQRTMPVQCERHAGALHRRLGIGQEQPGGVGHLRHALAAHIEAAYLVGRAEAVLHRTQHAQGGLGVALELADHIHQMLQRARPGDRPVLGHMPYQQHRHVQAFGRVDQGARHLAHLRGAAGDAIDLLGDDGLRRIDDGQRRALPLDQPQHGRQIGGGGQQQIRGHRVDACSPHAHLRLGLLAGQIQHGAIRMPLGHGAGGLQQQGGFADAGLSCDERDRSGHDAAAEDPVEFAEPGGQSMDGFGADLGDRRGGAVPDMKRRGARGAPGRGRARAGGGPRLAEFLHRAPLAAFGAAAIPFGAVPSAFGAYVLRRGLRHISTLSVFADKVCGRLCRSGAKPWDSPAARHAAVRESGACRILKVPLLMAS